MRIGPLPIPQAQEIQHLLETSRAGKTDAAPGIGGTAPAGAKFSNFLESAISAVDGKMKAADAEKTKLFTGEPTICTRR